MFLACGGALTVASDVASFVLMPQGPRDGWFLTQREKEVLSARMAQYREGGDKTSFSVVQQQGDNAGPQGLDHLLVCW